MNASYFLKTKNYPSGDRSIDNLKNLLNHRNRGLSLNNNDSEIVKAAKIFLLKYYINKAMDENNYQEVVNLTNYTNDYLNNRNMNISSFVNEMIQRLNAKIELEQFNKFRKDSRQIGEAINNNDTLSQEIKNDVKKILKNQKNNMLIKCLNNINYIDNYSPNLICNNAKDKLNILKYLYCLKIISLFRDIGVNNLDLSQKSLLTRIKDIKINLELNGVKDLTGFANIKNSDKWINIIKEIKTNNKVIDTSNNEYNIELTPGDGDCFFHSFGIKRDKACEKLLEDDNLKRKDLRSMIACDYKALILSNGVKKGSIKSVKDAIPLIMNQLKEKRDIDNLEVVFEQHLRTEEECRKYINNYVKKSGYWMEYPIRDGEGKNKCTMDAIAETNNKNLLIWKKKVGNSNKLQKLHSHEVDGVNVSTVNIIHTNFEDIKDSRNLNHFHKLKPV